MYSFIDNSFFVEIGRIAVTRAAVRSAIIYCIEEALRNNAADIGAQLLTEGIETDELFGVAVTLLELRGAPNSSVRAFNELVTRFRNTVEASQLAVDSGWTLLSGEKKNATYGLCAGREIRQGRWFPIYRKFTLIQVRELRHNLERAFSELNAFAGKIKFDREAEAET